MNALMRTFFSLALVWLLSVATALSEDIVQVLPLRIADGVAAEQQRQMLFVMNSSANADVWGYQLDILLPDGIQFDDSQGSPFHLDESRSPLTADATATEHQVDYAHLPSGWWRLIVTPDNDTRISGREGVVLTARYLTDEHLQAGIYPVTVKRSVIATNGANGVEPMQSASYIVAGSSPLSAHRAPHLRMLTGYLPTFVVDSLNHELASNLRITSLDVSRVDSLASGLQLLNPNALLLVKAGTGMAGETNAVALAQDGTATCHSLQLDEASGPFAAPLDFAVSQLHMVRPISNSKWNTLCLPFSMSAEQLTQLFGEVVVARFDSLRQNAFGQDVIRFAPIDLQTEMLEANVPYLFRPTVAVSDLQLQDVAVEQTGSLAQSGGGMTFIGSYEPGIPVPEGYYFISDNKFWLSHQQSTMLAFRGFFRDDRPSATRRVNLAFEVDEPEPVVTRLSLASPSFGSRTPYYYNLQGQRVNRMQRGIYVRNGRKIVNTRKN